MTVWNWHFRYSLKHGLCRLIGGCLSFLCPDGVGPLALETTNRTFREGSSCRLSPTPFPQSFTLTRLLPPPPAMCTFAKLDIQDFYFQSAASWACPSSLAALNMHHFFLWANSILLYAYHLFLVVLQSIGCFYFLVIMDNAAVNTGVQLFLDWFHFLWYILRSGIFTS